MQKLALISGLLLITGCSITMHKPGREDSVNAESSINSEEIRALNLTNNDFSIVKAQVEIRSSQGSQKMIVNMKFKSPGTYLLSTRSQAGIEAARAYISRDTILVNDRINKVLYYGSPEYMMEKYGISTNIIPVLLGDYVTEKSDSKTIKCHNNESEIAERYYDNRLNYFFNCNKRKVRVVSTYDDASKRGIRIDFDKFDNSQDMHYAKKIRMSDYENQTEIYISIDKIEKGTQAELSFIPGKNYKMVLLK